MSNFIQVSPRFKLDTNTFQVTSSRKEEDPFVFESKTAARLIYEDRMQGWFFEPVYELLKKNHTVLAVSIVTPLIESLENYIQGRQASGESRQFFQDGAKRIFPVLNPVPVLNPDPADTWAIDVLYEGVRCGFAHEGFLKERTTRKCNITIASQGQEQNPIIYDKNKEEMTIYAKGYVNKIQEEFQHYYDILGKDTSELNKFFKVWEKQWKMKGDKSQRISGTVSYN
jgi:hypothetical protein